MINKKGEIVGVKLVKNEYIRKNEKNLLIQFLEDYIQDE